MVGYRCALSGGGNYSYTAVSINPDTGVQTVYDSSCDYMFAYNATFNSPVVIGNNIISYNAMFMNCSEFNQDIYINYSGTSNIYLNNMLRNCVEFGKNVYISSLNANRIFTRSMLIGTSNSKRKNIFFNSMYNNQFNSTTASSIVGASITWTDMTNGFYNAAYNVYCFNNYN